MILFFGLMLFVPQISLAQDFLTFLSAKAPSTMLEAEGIFAPMANIEAGKDRSQVLQSSLNASHKIFDQSKSSVVIGGRWQKLDFSDRNSLLRDFYDAQASVGYRHRMSEDNFWSASLSYGSASDRPFQNGRDGTISFNYLQKFNSEWFGIINYSNNRSFLNNIPLPGFFYVNELGREKALILGFPIIYWMRPIRKHMSFRYFGILPWTHRFKLLYTKWGLIMPYLGYEQAPQSYFRHDRDSRRDRIFWFEKKVMLGVEGKLKEQIRFDLSTGLAFDRQLYEARNFSDNKNFLLNFNNSYFVGLNLRHNF